MQPVVVGPSLGRTVRWYQSADIVLVHKVLDNRTRFGDSDVTVRNDRRLSKRVDLEQLALYSVGNPQLFEQPEDSL
jgi:hypothetical protein